MIRGKNKLEKELRKVLTNADMYNIIIIARSSSGKIWRNSSAG